MLLNSWKSTWQSWKFRFLPNGAKGPWISFYKSNAKKNTRVKLMNKFYVINDENKAKRDGGVWVCVHLKQIDRSSS